MNKKDAIVIKGARQHNLKNINVEIPKNSFTVVTGLSGSGKSSLAFDTLYAEGQRRYVESLSSYARQFLGQMDKADVDSIDGLSPAISINQKTTSKNPRSTVGTVTEINDYFRLLFARIGKPDDPKDGTKIFVTIDQMVEFVLDKFSLKTKLQFLAPVLVDEKGTHEETFNKLKRLGYVRAKVDGELIYIDDFQQLSLDRNKNHTIEVVVDRIVLKEDSRSRIFDAFENSTQVSNGRANVEVIDGETYKFSDHYLGHLRDFKVGKLEPRLFSFNTPIGACPVCQGLGLIEEVDIDLVVPDKKLTLGEGAIAPWNPISSKYYPEMLEQAANHFKIVMDTPWEKLSKKDQNLILYGSKGKKFEFHYENDFGGIRDTKIEFEGVVNNVERRYKDSNAEFTREQMKKYLRAETCPECNGYRLNKGALSIKINGIHIGQLSEMSVDKEIDWFDNLRVSENDSEIASPIVKEISDRLSFLNSVGLNYLSLSRSSATLSGGESQRIRLATQIGSTLSGVLYVLDEPSIGLHQKDNGRLLDSMRQMRDLGNTLVVVEHDEDTMRAADYLIDIGPGAGEFGGQLIASGTPEEVQNNPNSLTGQYLSGAKKIEVPKTRRKGNKKFIEIKNATENNLKDISVKIPLGEFVSVTGVSGSGKSTLVNSILKKALKQKLNNNSDKPGKFGEIKGYDGIEKIIDIDQSPIGRNPRSNPATYTGVFDDIRDLFAQTNDAKLRGFTKRRFSFNVKGGRCENCHGDGVIKIEMNFLPDVYIVCEVCNGTRYNSETLEVRYHDLNISDVLNLTINRAVDFFNKIPKIKRKLQSLVDTGLDYMTLGQSATTLSGGEAQRMKLASELQKIHSGKNFYIFDEPTTGLHSDDVAKLLQVFHKLVDEGNTVVVIEHNLDVIKNTDWVIDLGPDGGVSGGTIVAEGTPEQVSKVKGSYTGEYLKEYLA